MSMMKNCLIPSENLAIVFELNTCLCASINIQKCYLHVFFGCYAIVHVRIPWNMLLDVDTLSFWSKVFYYIEMFECQVVIANNVQTSWSQEFE